MPPDTEQSHIQPFIEAWERLAEPRDDGAGPRLAEHPGLIDCLFLLARNQDGRMVFRKVAPGVERIFGRELVGCEFTSIWIGKYAADITATALRAMDDDLPITLRATAAQPGGGGARVDLALAPIQGQNGREPRFLGLCQRHKADASDATRPLLALELVGVAPPAGRRPAAQLRLVVSNP